MTNVVPFVHSLGPDGLSTTTWQDFALRLSEPFAKAAASRIAYGKTPPPYGGGVYYQPYPTGGGYYAGGYGGLDPQNLILIGGVLVGALVILKALK